MHACIHTYMCTFVTYVRMYIRTHTLICTHTLIRTHAHTRTRAHTYVHSTYIHTCMLMIIFGSTQRIEAESAYKQAVANANDCQYQVHISQVTYYAHALLVTHVYYHLYRNQFSVLSEEW